MKKEMQLGCKLVFLTNSNTHDATTTIVDEWYKEIEHSRPLLHYRRRIVSKRLLDCYFIQDKIMAKKYDFHFRPLTDHAEVLTNHIVTLNYPNR
jgi:hypothetical protein